MAGARPDSAPAQRAAPGGKRPLPQLAEGEIQRIWVYCQEPQEQHEILESCRASTRPRMSAETVDRSSTGTIQGAIRNLLSALPAPYGPNEWTQFWEDVGVLLAASLASSAHLRSQKRADKGSRAARWPPLLVTDHTKLCEASNSLELRQALAEVAHLQVWELLPVVLSANFGLLCGLLVEGEPLETCASQALRAPPAAAGPPPNMPVEACPVELRSGVYRQRSRGEGSAGGPEGEEPPTDSSALFGARCLALLPDGRCAYCAVSPDGARSVEASGPWEVINGHVVVGGAGGRAKVQHFRLSQGAAELLLDVSYEEPVHVSLEELASDFQPPVRLAHCAPRPGERLRASLLEPSHEAGAAEGPCPPPTRRASERWGAGLAGAVAEAAAEEEPQTLDRQRLLRTPVHALLSLASADSLGERAREQGRGPRLLGMQRGLTANGLRVAEDLASEHASSSASRVRADMARPSPAVQLTAYAAGFAEPETSEAYSVSTCPLRPGTYLFQAGRPSDLSQRSAELTLHADGGCHFREEVQGSTIRSVTGAAVWRVEGQLLVLDTLQSGMHGFLHRESHGNRSLERKVARVELSVAQVLSCCQHTPFAQQELPFPGYLPHSPSQRMFGLVDLDSPALQDMRCRPDRVPYHAFEHELRRRGLPVDAILSDFHFIDRDADGQISLADMLLLEGYGTPAAAPEVLHELVEALVRCFGSLQEAFEALKAGAGPKKVTLEEFEKFLQRTAAEGALHGDNSKLREWVEKTSVEDRVAVFASMNPNNNPVIDNTDFLSLHLHTAVLAVRRLEHFQSWLFEQFGRTDEVFRQVFDGLNAERAKVLTRRAFVDGAETLGYPCGPKATGSMFSLLDRNFDGEVSLRDFQKLRDFSAEQLLTSLEALKSFADRCLGGIDASFRKLLEREQALQGLQSLPKTASFAAFEKVCKQAGFGKSSPDYDLKMLFLFLAEASGRHSSGYLTSGEWALLKGFDSRALNGSPARLRRVLEAEYGGIDQAFQHMHTAWLQRALVQGLQQTALAGMAHSLWGSGGSSDSQRSQQRPPLAARPRAQSAQAARGGAAAWRGNAAAQAQTWSGPERRPPAGPQLLRSGGSKQRLRALSSSGSSQRLRRAPSAGPAPPAPPPGPPPAEPPSPSVSSAASAASERPLGAALGERRQAALRASLAPSAGPSTPDSSCCSRSEARSRAGSAKHGPASRHRFVGFLPGLASPGLYAGGGPASAIVWSST